MFNKFYNTRTMAKGLFAAAVISGSVAQNVSAADADSSAVAFPDKWMLRAGAYVVDDSNTQFSVSSDVARLTTKIALIIDNSTETSDI